jgi:serine/threonine protein kinase/tetratricopeptide (TPR) repeat protein
MSAEPHTVRSVFLAAVENCAPDQWDAFLQEACAGDQDLRRRVEVLLRAHQQPNSLLDSPAAALVATIDEPTTERPGTVIGPYKLLEQIGEGGFALVFVAEQQQPVRRKVALKVLKPGMDTRQVVARFEAERQALALMDHPHIAKVFDGGETPAGRPYFVMELVKGVPITDFCDHSRLGVRERLGLFVDVCQAMQHAHQKGIIHRDLKPSNVLVTLHDDKVVVKVIDFGVAKATGQQLTDKTLFTNFAQMIGTPLYMSPEQARLSGLDIDTRSDIYALGVLLYELLTGTTPFDRERLRAAGYDEMRRIIREEEPARPSTRLSTPGPTSVTVSANRQSDPKKLTRVLRGELDWIVMKAVEKDRNRRYESASAFAADVRRYLNDEPVSACPPSTAYRLGKFVRRYKGPVAATILTLLCLIGGIIGTSWGMLRAIDAESVARFEGIEKDKAAKKAQEQAAIATSISESLKQMLGSLVPGGPDYTARQLLDDYADNLETKLADQLEIAADLHIILGRAYACLDARDKAKQHLERALVLRRGLFGERHEKYAEAVIEHARPDASLEWARCETDLRRALAIYRERGVGGEPVIYALCILQWLLAERARGGLAAKWDEVEAVLQEGLAEARKFPGQTFPKIADLYGGCACAKMARGQYAEAETLSREALAMGRKVYGPDGYPVAWGYFNLADALRHQGKFREASQADKQALAIMRKVLPPGHKCIAWALTAALNTLDQADHAHVPADPFPSGADWKEWESIFHEVARTTKPARLDRNDPVLSAIDGLALCSEYQARLADEWAASGNSQEAEQTRLNVVQLWQDLQTNFAGNAQVRPYICGRGAVALIQARQSERARDCCRKLLAQEAPAAGPSCNSLAWFLALATADLRRHGEPVLANELAKKAVELATKAVESDPRNGNYRNTLGVARYRAGDWKQAISDLEQPIVLCEGGTSFDGFFLAMAYWQMGNEDEARKWYDRAVQWMYKSQPNNLELRRFRAEAAELLKVEPKKD